MQVKKFEARTMKEALEMVKTQLGPDAIILSAKDNGRGFGLSGQKSVEITAAVSEETLKKKKFAESRVRKEELAKLQKSSARVQRNFIDNVVNGYMKETAPRPPITSTQYIDIADENQINAQPAAPLETEKATERIKGAAQRAWNVMHAHGAWVDEPESPRGRVSAVPASEEVTQLKNELAQLKTVLHQFQKVPQTLPGAHPGAEYGLSYDFSAIYEKLVQNGVATEIAAEILVEAQKQMPPIKYKNKALVEGWVAKYILDTTRVTGELAGTKVQAFVGPAGSGKSTAMVKLAAHYVVNARKKVALVTADTQKVGAIDQMRIYAQILNVPFAIIRNSQDWSYVLQQLRGYDYILCDCQASSLKTIEEIQGLKAVLPNSSEGSTIHLVLSATAKDQDLSEVGRRYKSVGFKDIIFTSLDDSAHHGSIYNFVRRFEIPLHSFGIGPRVPEDFEVATRERVLDLIFKLSKMKK
jgi:flagellar biosynthesis protein FlhF